MGVALNENRIDEEDGMRRELLATCIAAMVGLTTAGCASTSQTERTEGEPGDSQQTVVEVTNNNELQVSVEAVSSGGDRRLGQVAANRTATFELPDGVDETDLRIQVNPMGSAERYVSPRLRVREGDVVTVRVESTLELTTVAVR